MVGCPGGALDRTPFSRKDAAKLAALVAVLVALQAIRLLTRPGDVSEQEEAYNAAVGFAVWRGGLWDQLLPLQYSTFCGGCTVVGLLAAPVLGLGGDHFLLWKGIALAWEVATLLAGFAAADRWAGRRAAWVLAAFLAVPPPGYASLSLLLWGNHQETGLFVLGALALVPESGIAAGFLAGFAIWFCRTAAYGAVVVVPAAAWIHRRWTPLLAAAAGLSLLALPAGRGDTLGYDMSVGGNVLPNGVLAAIVKWARLFDPTRLADPAFASTPGSTVCAAILVAVALAAAGILVAGRDPRRIALLALPAAFSASWAITGFEWSHVAVLYNDRYYAPWILLLLLTIAAGLGPWLDRTGRRRTAAIAGIGAILLLDAGGFVAATLHRRLDTSVFDMPATHLGKLADVAWLRIPPDRIAAATSADPAVERALRRIEGLQRGRARGRAAVAETTNPEVRRAIGMTLPSPQDDPHALDAWLGTLPPDAARDVGRGIARALLDPGAAAPAPTVDAEVARLSTSDACYLCAAAGAAMLDTCERGPPPKLPACLAAMPRVPDAMLGVGWVFSLHRNRDRANDVAAALPPDLRAEFLAGLGDPVLAVRPPERRPGDRRPPR